jgi:ribosomal protein S18 acetylase RimI-like enzyme
MGPCIRPMGPKDLDPLLDIVRRTGMFSADEVGIARELMDIWLNRPGQKDYIIWTAEQDGAPVGYVCYGPTPATQKTYDLYWIAVEPRLQGKGFGRQLLRFAEDAIHSLGGRLVIIETSSTPKYEPTRAFYLRNGYAVEASIKDFYSDGDDRLIFTRRMPETKGGRE